MALDSSLRVRVAPSPTGLLHVGVTRTAIFNWLLARHHGGKFILRIEDTDRSRCQPEYEQNTYEALRWLGLDWDEGPEVGGQYGPYVQSQRVDIYRERARWLVENGHAYDCYCSPERLAEMRREQEQRGEGPGYDRRCRDLSTEECARQEAAGIVPTVRFAMPTSGQTAFEDLIRGHIVFDNAQLDDFIILKSDGFPTYHLAAVTDDHLMHITHILRGDDWIATTPLHALLYRAFSWDPPAFGHLPIVLGPDRAKLSKRHGATAVTAYRDQGYLPEALFNFLALLGWSPGDDREVMTREEMVQAFSIEGIGKAPSIFDLTKLEWMNGQYIRALGADAFADAAWPFLVQARLVSSDPPPAEREYAHRVLALEQERVRVLSELPRVTSFFFRADPEYDPAAVKKWLTKEYAPRALAVLADRFQTLEPFDVEHIEAMVRGLAEEMGLKAAALIHPVRVAVTGRTAGPGLFETLEILGKERCVARLRKADKVAVADQDRA
jgi:glutamyl-tRNA synthetase